MAHHSVEITDANFEEKVLKSDVPVMLDFWAPWCGPCLAIGPSVEELAQEFSGKVVVGKVNVDDNAQVSQRFGIMNIPTLLFFKNGQIVDKQVGASNKKALQGRLEALLTKV